jgi:hypothetical protein
VWAKRTHCLLAGLLEEVGCNFVLQCVHISWRENPSETVKIPANCKQPEGPRLSTWSPLHNTNCTWQSEYHCLRNKSVKIRIVRNQVLYF